MLKVIFIFEDSNKQKFYPMRRNVSLETTIRELAEMIKEKHGINDRIIIKYKENRRKCSINPNETVNSIQDKIKETDQNGRTQYFLYVEIQTKPNKYNKDKYTISPINIDEDRFYGEAESFYVDHPRVKKRPNLIENKMTSNFIKIIFIFEDSNEQKFYPIRRNVSLETTIRELAEMIKEKHGINDRIIIKYKEKRRKCSINPNKTVNSIQDKIKETDQNGRTQYFMYVEIQTKSKKPESKFEFEIVNEPKYKPEYKHKSESESESELKYESESESKSEYEYESKSESEYESELKYESKSESISKSKSEYISEYEYESKSKSESKSEPENEYKSKSESKSEPENEYKSKSESKYKNESESKHELESKYELESKHESGSESKSSRSSSFDEDKKDELKDEDEKDDKKVSFHPLFKIRRKVAFKNDEFKSESEEFSPLRSKLVKSPLIVKPKIKKS